MQVNSDNSRAMSVLTFLLIKLNTLQKKSSNFESAEAMVCWPRWIEFTPGCFVTTKYQMVHISQSEKRKTSHEIITSNCQLYCPFPLVNLCGRESSCDIRRDCWHHFVSEWDLGRDAQRICQFKQKDLWWVPWLRWNELRKTSHEIGE